MTTPPREPALDRTQRLHWAWVVAAVTFVTLVGAAAFRSVPGVLIEPLHDEFGWSHGLIGSAVSLNLMLFGLISPFAAALMDRFGVRPVVTFALVMVAGCELAGATVWPGQRDRMLAAVVLGLCWLVACRVVEWAHWHVQRLRGVRPPRAVVVVGSRPAISRWLDETAAGVGEELVVVAACVVGRHGRGGDLPTVFGTDHVLEAVTVELLGQLGDP